MGAVRQPGRPGAWRTTRARRHASPLVQQTWGSTLGVRLSRRHRRLLDQPDRATGGTDHGSGKATRAIATLQDLDDDWPFVVTRNEKEYVAGAVQARERERDARHRRLDCRR